MNNTAGSGIYDIGTGSPVSFQHVAELVAKKEDGKINTIPFPDHFKYQTYTCAERKNSKLSKTISDTKLTNMC